MIKFCKWCGMPFETEENQKFCSDKCQKKFKPPKRKTKVNLSISEIQKRAEAEGLTYGQYVGKYNI